MQLPIRLYRIAARRPPSSLATNSQLFLPIATIRNAGGLAVLAHPRQMQRPFAEIRAIVEQLVAWGLEGMEVIHPDHSADDVRMFGLMAERQGLIVTGGTDFHGHLRHGVQLGVGHGRLRVPPECVAQIRQRLAAR